ncbi:MAG: hypothetical protein AB7O28_20270 [Vicinamibacterales bacterium]
MPTSSRAVLTWLLDADPALRWQVRRDLAGESAAAVAADRARVAAEGWGAALLARQRADGAWAHESFPVWQTTLNAMVLLQDFGLDPAGPHARTVVERLDRGFTWGPEFGDLPFFEGEVEPCINGRVLAVGAYFGRPSARLADRLLGEQLADGGWNCEAERGSVRSSFHSTICVLEGLLAYEAACGPSAPITAARVRAHDYLLARGLFRRLATGAVVDRAWTRFAWPAGWHYDVLRGLDYLRRAAVAPEPRAAEALALVARRRHQNGRWPRGVVHEDPVGLAMEGPRGTASRWITFRALRVLDWAGA